MLAATRRLLWIEAEGSAAGAGGTGAASGAAEAAGAAAPQPQEGAAAAQPHEGAAAVQHEGAEQPQLGVEQQLFLQQWPENRLSSRPRWQQLFLQQLPQLLPQAGAAQPHEGAAEQAGSQAGAALQAGSQAGAAQAQLASQAGAPQLVPQVLPQPQAGLQQRWWQANKLCTLQCKLSRIWPAQQWRWQQLFLQQLPQLLPQAGAQPHDGAAQQLGSQAGAAAQLCSQAGAAQQLGSAAA